LLEITANGEVVALCNRHPTDSEEPLRIMTCHIADRPSTNHLFEHSPLWRGLWLPAMLLILVLAFIVLVLVVP
jgi:hypothetical protein